LEIFDGTQREGKGERLETSWLVTPSFLVK